MTKPLHKDRLTAVPRADKDSGNNQTASETNAPPALPISDETRAGDSTEFARAEKLVSANDTAENSTDKTGFTRANSVQDLPAHFDSSEETDNETKLSRATETVSAGSLNTNVSKSLSRLLDRLASSRLSKAGLRLIPRSIPGSGLLSELGLYSDWIRRWHTLPVRDWIRGATAFETGNFQLAAECYRRGLEKRPGHVAASHARFDYGYCLYRLGRLPEARTVLTETISTNNRLRDAYLLLARVHLIFGHNRSAMQTLKRCVELLPGDISAMTSYFHLLVSCGYDSARLNLLREELIRNKSKLPLDDFGQEQIDGCLAAFELKYGNRQKGERLLARVLASGRAPYDVILLRGELFLADNRIIQAREQFARAARVAPRDPRPFMFLAKTYMAESPFQELEWALQSATTACRLSSYENAECVSTLVRAYELNGETDVALLFIEKMRELPSTRQLNIEQMLTFKKELQRLRHLNA